MGCPDRQIRGRRCCTIGNGWIGVRIGVRRRRKWQENLLLDCRAQCCPVWCFFVSWEWAHGIVLWFKALVFDPSTTLTSFSRIWVCLANSESSFRTLRHGLFHAMVQVTTTRWLIDNHDVLQILSAIPRMPRDCSIHIQNYNITK